LKPIQSKHIFPIEDSILLILMFFSPMAFGSVHAWAYSLLCLFSTMIFMIHFLRNPANLLQLIKRKEVVFAIVFIIFQIVYVIPITPAILKMISPNAYLIRNDYMTEPAKYMFLSVFPYITITYIMRIIAYFFVFLYVLSRMNIHDCPQTPDVRINRLNSYVFAGAVSACMAMAFHSLTDFNLHIPANALYFVVMLSLVAGLSFDKKNHVNAAYVSRMVNFIVSIGSAIALFAIIQKFSWNGKMFWIFKKVGGNFGPYVNYDHFAGFMEMCTCIAVARLTGLIRVSGIFYIRNIKDKLVWFSTKEANAVLTSFIMTVVMITSLFMSTSRGGILSFLAAMGIFFGGVICSARRGRRMRIIGTLLVIMFVAGIMFIWAGPEEAVSRYQSLQKVITFIIKEKPIMNELRPKFWKDTVQIIKDYPVAGTGLGTFYRIFPAYRTFPGKHGFLRYAHNDYLQYFSENGSVGALFLGIFFFWYIGRIRRCLRDLSEEKQFKR